MNIKDIRHRLIPYKKNSKNKVYDKECHFISLPIYLFYHIYCGPNDWKGIFSEQIELIKSSGLYEKVSHFYLAIVGNEKDRDLILSQIGHKNIEIVYFSEDGSCYEFPCLVKMKELAKFKSFYALYLHTKGSSYSQLNYNNKLGDFKSLWINTFEWRAIMNYYNIKKWNMAINTLSNGYNTYGCLLMSPHSRIKKYHYSGNFWWTTSENIKKCNDINNNEMNNRWMAELWIINDGNKAYCPFFSYLLLYEAIILPSTYTKPWYHLNNIKYFFYYITSGRKHLLY